MNELLYAPEGPVTVTVELQAAAQAALDELLIEQPDKRAALVKGFQLLALWHVLDAETAVVPSSRGDETYTVTAATCTCPAYLKPLEARPPAEPRFCYHRGGLLILRRALTRLKRNEAPVRPLPDYVPGLRLPAGHVWRLADVRAMRRKVEVLKGTK